MNPEFESGCGVAVLEPQPIVVEGLRAVLNMSGNFRLVEPATTLDAMTALVMATSPRVVILDKSIGTLAIVEWLESIRDWSTFVVVWGASMTDAEAVRLMKAGARGVIRKTVDAPTLLACLDAVVAGNTWMEEALFPENVRRERGRPELTLREQQVLELVQQGLRNKDIADQLGIRPGTVKIHLKHIFEKTGVHGRFGLALNGIRERGAFTECLAS